MILWVDPGIRKLWYAVVDFGSWTDILDWGILLLDQKNPSRDDQFERMSKIYNFFEKLIKKYKISTLSIEKLFFTKFNQSNAEFVYGIRWIIIMLCIRQNIKIKEFTPIQLKKFITWNAKADKILVQKCIMKFFNLANLPQYNDTADALALAYIASKIKA